MDDAVVGLQTLVMPHFNIRLTFRLCHTELRDDFWFTMAHEIYIITVLFGCVGIHRWIAT